MTDTSPMNIEVEQALIGSLLANNNLVPLVGYIVKPEHFSERLHARIYNAICKLHSKGASATALTLKPQFEHDDTMAEIGGTTYLVNLTAKAQPIVAKSHARHIRDLAQRRAVVEACDYLAREAAVPAADDGFERIIAEHVSEMSSIIEGSHSRKHLFSLGEASDVVLERLSRMGNGETDPNAIPTGLTQLDAATGGLKRGAFNILAGRPSMGKSAIGVQIALNAARAGHGVLYSSLEMSAVSLQERIYSSWLWSPNTRIQYVEISRGLVGERELRWLQEARDDVEQLPMVIDDRAQLSPSDIEVQARVVASRFQRKGKSLDLLVVDHIHKMIAPPLQKPVEVFSNISAHLADLSKKLDCAVLCLAQLNRGVEGREDKRPLLSDLRESGAIEQDADVVMFAFRQSYYLERHKGKSIGDETDRLAKLSECWNQLELIIAKNRQGPISTVDLWADMACNVIRDPRDHQATEVRAA